MLLLGTTDTPYEGEPADVTATEAASIGSSARRLWPWTQAAPARRSVLSTYAGLRVLPCSDGSTVDARRETAIPFGEGRHAHSRRRQAHDIPEDRTRGASPHVGGARVLPCRPSARSASGRNGRRQRGRSAYHRLGTGAAGRGASRRTSTAQGRTVSSASRPNGSFSSGCTPMRPTSPLRPYSPHGGMGDDCRRRHSAPDIPGCSRSRRPSARGGCRGAPRAGGRGLCRPLRGCVRLTTADQTDIHHPA